MDNTEFQKIWTLMTSLWPAAAAKKSKVDIAVWRRGLEPYAMEEVSDRIMLYAQQNNYFPDLSDVTGKLLRKDYGVETKIIRTMKLLAKMRGLEAPEVSTAAEAFAWCRENAAALGMEGEEFPIAVTKHHFQEAET